MNTTQSHLSISDVKNDILLLDGGGGALVLQVSAVNFGLLSEEEQIAIISAFAQMLNSLSFSIQILIRSERLDISSYLVLLNQALKRQTNPLLSQIMQGYIRFVQSTIKENDVLDKNFYIVIPLFRLELGLTTSSQILEEKIRTILVPRKDQLLKQLGRIGLKSTQLTGEKLLRLFYDIYNQVEETAEFIPQEPVNLKPPKMPTANPQEKAQTRDIPVKTPPTEVNRSKTHPFVVEELEDNV